MSIADKLTTIAENEQKVYDKGVTDGNNEMDLKHLECITGNGKRTSWNYFLTGTDYTGYTFPATVKVSGNNRYYFSNMFYDYRGTHLPANIDLSGIAENTILTGWFTWSTKLVEIPDMGLPAVSFDSITACTALKKIEVIRCNGTNSVLQFSNCPNLEEIRIEGTIGKNVSFYNSPLLTYETLMSIINALKDYSEDTSGTVYTCSIGSANLEKLAEEEQQIATDKGWTLS
ncbi:MAG: hypothetical protein IJN62_00745 [Clostridia bacterium]|nr:hypothetical protein [Clostridia bacterium]